MPASINRHLNLKRTSISSRVIKSCRNLTESEQAENFLAFCVGVEEGNRIEQEQQWTT